MPTARHDKKAAPMNGSSTVAKQDLHRDRTSGHATKWEMSQGPTLDE